MNEHSTGVRLFRTFVLILVAFHFIQNLIPGLHSTEFGWNWRFLTVWGQTLSFVVAAIMLARTYGLTAAQPDTLVSVTVVTNLLVVFLYWQLYFTDPALVNGDGEGSVWWREYYVHLMGPVFQWIDAFLIFGCFRRMPRIIPASIAIMLTYVAWIELALRPLSGKPMGKITSGLPYPFLNDMIVPERVIFYSTTILTALVFMAICWLLALMLRRFARLGR